MHLNKHQRDPKNSFIKQCISCALSIARMQQFVFVLYSYSDLWKLYGFCNEWNLQISYFWKMKTTINRVIWRRKEFISSSLRAMQQLMTAFIDGSNLMNMRSLAVFWCSHSEWTVMQPNFVFTQSFISQGIIVNLFSTVSDKSCPGLCMSVAVW